MTLFSRMLQNTADRFLYAVGNQEAAGRLNLSFATAEVRKQWARYAGRKGIRAPTIRHISNFLTLEYGLQLDDDIVGRLVKVSGHDEAVPMDMALPRIANALLDSGVLVFNRD